MNDLEHPPFISVEAAIRRGRARVMYPPLAFFALAAIAVALGVGHTPDWVWVAACVAAFVTSWLWWSVTLPRWRVWAIENVEDPGELILLAVASQLMWPPGHFVERTEVRPRELENRLLWALQLALRRLRTSDPNRAAMLQELVEPWLHPGHIRTQAAAGRMASGGNIALTVGPIALALAVAVVVQHVVYGSDISVGWTAAGIAVGLALSVIGRNRAGATWSSVAQWFLFYCGLILAAGALRSDSWGTANFVVLAVGVAAVLAGGMGLRSGGR